LSCLATTFKKEGHFYQGRTGPEERGKTSQHGIKIFPRSFSEKGGPAFEIDQALQAGREKKKGGKRRVFFLGRGKVKKSAHKKGNYAAGRHEENLTL